MFNHQSINPGKVLFINASQNRDGNTAAMGKKLFNGIDFDQINLVDYKIYQIGQNFSDDQFEEVYQKMAMADTVVLGTPTYWHEMSGFLKTLIERIGQYPDQTGLKGKNLALIMQGAFPMDGVKETDAIIKRFCSVGKMNYVGSAGSSMAISNLRSRLGIN